MSLFKSVSQFNLPSLSSSLLTSLQSRTALPSLHSSLRISSSTGAIRGLKSDLRRVQIKLLTDVEHLGQAGDVVKVRSGYARNFLIPQRLALYEAVPRVVRLPAKEYEKYLQEKMKDAGTSEADSVKVRETYRMVYSHDKRRAIERKPMIFGRLTTNVGKLEVPHRPVTKKQIFINLQQKFKLLAITLDDIQLPNDFIQSFGLHDVPITIDNKICTLKVNIVSVPPTRKLTEEEKRAKREEKSTKSSSTENFM